MLWQELQRCQAPDWDDWISSHGHLAQSWQAMHHAACGAANARSDLQEVAVMLRAYDQAMQQLQDQLHKLSEAMSQALPCQESTADVSIDPNIAEASEPEAFTSFPRVRMFQPAFCSGSDSDDDAEIDGEGSCDELQPHMPFAGGPSRISEGCIGQLCPAEPDQPPPMLNPRPGMRIPQHVITATFTPAFTSQAASHQLLTLYNAILDAEDGNLHFASHEIAACRERFWDVRLRIAQEHHEQITEVMLESLSLDAAACVKNSSDFLLQLESYAVEATAMAHDSVPEGLSEMLPSELVVLYTKYELFGFPAGVWKHIWLAPADQTAIAADWAPAEKGSNPLFGGCCGSWPALRAAWPGTACQRVCLQCFNQADSHPQQSLG